MAYNRDERAFIATVMRGAAAISESLEFIGSGVEDGDKRLAKCVVDNEMSLRALLTYALEKLAGEA